MREAFRKRAIEYEPSGLDKSKIYVELPLVNSGCIELLDDDALLRELRGLERRRGTAGRDRVDHRPGSHDDRANAVAGVCWCAAEAGSTGAYRIDVLIADDPKVARPRHFGDSAIEPRPTIRAAVVRNATTHTD